jgi:hypothetical protein
VSPDQRSVARALLWWGAVTATVLNGVVVGYGAVWFQLFGETADAEDYRMSAGGYGAAALVLTFAAVAVRTHRAPRSLFWPTVVSAVLLALLCARSAAAAGGAEPDRIPVSSAWDGIGGVLWAPWTWALVGLGVHGLYRVVRPG